MALIQLVDDFDPSGPQQGCCRQVGAVFEQAGSFRIKLGDLLRDLLERGDATLNAFVDPCHGPCGALIIKAEQTDGSHQPRCRGEQKGPAPVIRSRLLQRRRLKTDRHGAFSGQFPQSQADALPEQMRGARETRPIDSGTDADAPYRVEKFDGQGEFFVEELQSIRHRNATSGEISVHGRGPFLARAVERHGPGDLVVDPGHDGTRDLGHFRNVLVLCPVVIARRWNETFAALELLDFIEAASLELFLERHRDGVAADRQSADEEVVSLDKKQVGGTRPDVDEQGATAGVRVIIAESIVECGGRCLDKIRRQFGDAQSFDRGFQRLGFCRNDQGSQLALLAVRQDLIGPGDVLDRVGNILLGLVEEDLPDGVRFHLGDLHEAAKNTLRRDGAGTRATFPP